MLADSSGSSSPSPRNVDKGLGRQTPTLEAADLDRAGGRGGPCEPSRVSARRAFISPPCVDAAGCPTKGNLLDHEQGLLPFRRVQPLPDTLRHQQLAGVKTMACTGPGAMA